MARSRWGRCHAHFCLRSTTQTTNNGALERPGRGEEREQHRAKKADMGGAGRALPRRSMRRFQLAISPGLRVTLTASDEA